MDSTHFSFDSQEFSGYHQRSVRFADDPNLTETLETDGGDPTSRQESPLMAPPVPDGHESFMQTSDLSNDENSEEEQVDTRNGEGEEGVEGAPWSVDWKGLATETLKKALEGFKVNAKSLSVAIDTFVDETNAIHSDWNELLQDERAESQRLDGLEPGIRDATMGAGQVYGGEGFLAGRDASTLP